MASCSRRAHACRCVALHVCMRPKKRKALIAQSASVPEKSISEPICGRQRYPKLVHLRLLAPWPMCIVQQIRQRDGIGTCVSSPFWGGWAPRSMLFRLLAPCSLGVPAAGSAMGSKKPMPPMACSGNNTFRCLR